jgi:hypothetical protein
VLSEDGRNKKRISFYDLLHNHLDMEALARFVVTKGKSGDDFRFMDGFVDAFHTNTLEIIRSTQNNVFQEGFVLFCARSLDLVGVVDIDNEALVWSWGKGVLDWPHQPTLKEDGNLLIFDNGAHRQRSRIIELAPLEGEIVWEYQGDPPGSFFSMIMGGVQALPNGNVLITESIRGRAFEVDREGNKVWEFHNPDIDEEKEKRATIYRMTRIPMDYLGDRLQQAPSS